MEKGKRKPMSWLLGESKLYRMTSLGAILAMLLFGTITILSIWI